MAHRRPRDDSIVSSVLGSMRERDSDLIKLEKQLGRRDKVISKRQDELRSVLEVLKGSGELQAAIEADSVLDEKLVELSEGRKRVTDLEMLLHSKTTTVMTKETHLNSKEARLESLDTEHSSLRTSLVEREDHLRAREETLRKRMASIDQHDFTITQREARLRERAAVMESREKSHAEREEQLLKKEREVASASGDLTTLKRKAVHKTNEAEKITDTIKERQTTLAHAEDEFNQKLVSQASREQRLLAREAALASNTTEMEERAADIDRQQTSLSVATASLTQREATLVGLEEKAKVAERQRQANEEAEASLREREVRIVDLEREVRSREISMRDYEAMHTARMRELHTQLAEAKEKQQLLDDQLLDVSTEKQVAELSFQSIDVASAAAEQQRSELRCLEEQLANRQEELETRECRVAEAEKSNNALLENTTRVEETASKRERRVREREVQCDDREKNLTDHEATVARRLEEADRLLAGVPSPKSACSGGSGLLFPNLFEAEEQRLKRRKQLLAARERDAEERQSRNSDREWALKQREARLLKYFEDRADMVNMLLEDVRSKQMRLDTEYYHKGKRLIEQKEQLKRKLAECIERGKLMREPQGARGKSVLEAELALAREEGLSQSLRLKQLEETESTAKRMMKDAEAQKAVLRSEQLELDDRRTVFLKEKRQLLSEQSTLQTEHTQVSLEHSTKEKALLHQEKDITQKLEGLKEAELDLGRRRHTLQELEQQLLDKARVLDEEAAVQAEISEERENIHRLKLRELDEEEVTLQTAKGSVHSIEAKHGELTDRERAVRDNETLLRQQQAVLEIDANEVEVKRAAVDKEAAALREREAVVTHREAAARQSADLMKKLEEKRLVLQERDAEHTLREAGFKQREEALHSLESQIEQTQLQLQTQQQNTVHRSLVSATKEESLKQHEEFIFAKQKSLAEKEEDLIEQGKRLENTSLDLQTREEELLADIRQRDASYTERAQTLEKLAAQLKERESSMLSLEVTLQQREVGVHQAQLRQEQDTLATRNKTEDMLHKEKVLQTRKEGLDKQEAVIDAKVADVSRRERSLEDISATLEEERKAYTALKKSSTSELDTREHIVAEHEVRVTSLSVELAQQRDHQEALQAELQRSEATATKAAERNKQLALENDKARAELIHGKEKLQQELSDVEAGSAHLVERANALSEGERKQAQLKAQHTSAAEALHAYEKQNRFEIETTLADQREQSALLAKREQSVAVREAVTKGLEEALAVKEAQAESMQAALTSSQAALETDLAEMAAKLREVEERQQQVDTTSAVQMETELRLEQTAADLGRKTRMLEDEQASWKNARLKQHSELLSREEAVKQQEEDMPRRQQDVNLLKVALEAQREDLGRQQERLQATASSHEVLRKEQQQKELELTEQAMSVRMKEQALSELVDTKVKEKAEALGSKGLALEALERSLQQRDHDLTLANEVQAEREKRITTESEAVRRQQADVVAKQRDFGSKLEELTLREVKVQGTEEKLAGLAKKEDEVNELRVQLTALKQDLDKRAASVKQQQQDTGKSHTEVLKQKDMLYERMAQLTQLKDEASRQQAELHAREQELASKERIAAQLAENVTAKDTALSRTHEKLTHMQGELQAKEERVRHASADFEVRSRELQQGQARLEEAKRSTQLKMEAVERDCNQLQEDKETVHTEHTTLILLRQEVETRQSVLEDTEAKAAELQAKEAHLAKQEDELKVAAREAAMQMQRASELKYEFGLRLRAIEERDEELREKETEVGSALLRAHEEEEAAVSKHVSVSRQERHSVERERVLGEREKGLTGRELSLQDELDAHSEAVGRLKAEQEALEEESSRKLAQLEERLAKADSEVLRANELEREAHQLLLTTQRKEREMVEEGLELERKKNTHQQHAIDEAERLRKLEVTLLQREHSLEQREDQVRQGEEAWHHEHDGVKQQLGEQKAKFKVVEAGLMRREQVVAGKDREQHQRGLDITEKEQALKGRETALEAREEDVAGRWKVLMGEIDEHGRKERETTIALRKEARRLGLLKDALHRKEVQLLGNKTTLRRTLESVESTASSPSTVPARLHSPRSLPHSSPSPEYSGGLSPPPREPSSYGVEFNMVALYRCWCRWAAVAHRGRVGRMFYQNKEDAKLRAVFGRWVVCSVRRKTKKDASIRRGQVRQAQREIEKLSERVLEGHVDRRKFMDRYTGRLQKVSEMLHANNSRKLLSKWMLRWVCNVTMIGLVEYSKMEIRLEALEVMQCTPTHPQADPTPTPKIFAKFGLDVTERTHHCSLCSSSVMVSSTVPRGPASDSGIIPGDIIVAVGAERVSTVGGFRRAVMAYLPGAPCDIQVCRVVKLHWVKLVSYQNKATMLSESPSPAARDYPLTVSPMTGGSGRSVSALSINPKPPPTIDQVFDLSRKIDLPPDRH